MNSKRPPFLERITIEPVLVLTTAWYALMFFPEITRHVLFNGPNVADLGQLDLTFSAGFLVNSVVFFVVTAALILSYFYLAPGIKNRFLSFLFCLPWAPVGAAIYIFVLGLIPAGSEIISGGFSTAADNLKGLMSLVVIVPLMMIMTAWFPILVLKPLTVHLAFATYRKRKQKWSSEIAFQTTCEQKPTTPISSGPVVSAPLREAQSPGR